MKNLRFLIAALGLVVAVGSASAQQAPQASPEIMVLQSKLMREINAGLQCELQAFSLQQQVEKITAELTALKAKYEPAAPSPK